MSFFYLQKKTSSSISLVSMLLYVIVFEFLFFFSQTENNNYDTLPKRKTQWSKRVTFYTRSLQMV